MLSSTPTLASPLRDRVIKLRSLQLNTKGQEQLFKEKIDGQQRDTSSCGLAACLLVLQRGHGGAPLGWRATNKMCMNTTPLWELWRSSTPIAEPFHQAQSCRTLALLYTPCILQDPTPAPALNPPPNRAPSHCRGASRWVKDSWTQTGHAASLPINPFLPLPGLTPSKSDFTEHQRDAKSIYQVGLWALEKMAPGRPRGDRPEWHHSPHKATAWCQSLPHSQVAVPVGTWGSTTRLVGCFFFLKKKSWFLGF